jgi:hypothetical protein
MKTLEQEYVKLKLPKGPKLPKAPKYKTAKSMRRYKRSLMKGSVMATTFGAENNPGKKY